MPRCDIIIPVYNAYDAVIECIDSVLKNTDFSKAHLILIDDKSPDERIIPLLEKYEQNNVNKITFLKNEKNLGFVGTVNRGMKHSKNDVLLLNSDTEVPEGWLDRIRKCAYSDETIATVTPLSNNATLASVPKMFERNELPKDYDLDRMDKLVEKYSMVDYPEIPTAHGFCMYIKRGVLDKVGYFDEENFGKGYGEENDFSFRCFEFGLRNVLCDNVYVLHKESQSFLDNKVDNGAALAKKHPELKNNLDYWCGQRDIRKIGDNIALAVGVERRRPNILILVHDFSNIENNVGGTTLHILDIIRSLRDKYNFHVLAPEGNVYKVYSFFEDTEVWTAVYDKPIIIEKVGLYSREYGKLLEEVIDDYGMSFVHIHHMVGHFFDVGRICKRKKVKYAVSIHDMYLKSPIVSMLDEKVRKELNYPIELAEWRKVCGELMMGAVKVIAPSKFAKKEYEKVYDGIKVQVIQHGVNVKKATAKNELGLVKNIAFVGAIFPHKGSEILEKLVRKVKKADNIKIHLFGMTTVDIRNNKIFVNHGSYKRENLARALKENKIDLVCVFALAPETFAYTVDEVVAAGVPVLTFDIGAGAARVREHNLGWVMEYSDDVGVVYEEIKNILGNVNGYEKVIDSLNEYKISSVKQMVRKYDEIYGDYVEVRELDFEVLQKKLLRTELVRNVMDRIGGRNYAEDYFAVINSRKWKVISKVKVPKNLKKIVKNIYNLRRG